ncbi:MAG: diaminopimelate decarboxylase [Actinomycetaceae bacterium]|nr:diaminopimelate decarboxylase [Actinomycetaceae bacterium]
MSVELENVKCPEPDGSAGGVWPRGVERGADGELRIAGLAASELVRDFPTSVFVIDEADMRARAAEWKAAMDEAFAEAAGLAGASVFYAGKAFLSVGVARWMSDEGLGIDTCSAGELTTALAAGVAPEKLGLHGNNKSVREITMALDAGVAHLVVDSLAELALVEEIARERGAKANIMLRVTTGVHAGGHEFIATAHEDQKFGLSVTAGVAREAIEKVVASEHLELVGLHSHIGSQILNLDAFVQALDVVLNLRGEAMKDLGCDIPEIDCGGGYAVRYTALDDVPPAPREYATALAAAVRGHAERTGVPAPHISIEPGRSIAAPACMTIYTVGTIKDVQLEEGGQRRYVSVDGGMSDNIRPALYDAQYTASVISRQAGDESVRSRVVGKHCESGDIVVHDVALPADIRAGDLLAVPVTGAYGRSMASNYNMLTRPGVVAVRDGQARYLVRPETVEDLLNLDADA